MSNKYTFEREYCPACKSKKHKTIYSCGFLESPIKEYLESFYSPQGKIEFSYLEKAMFILEECIDCGLVFQKEVPGDFLMEKIYEEWIDPQNDLQKHLQKYDLDYFARNAQEIMTIIAYFNKSPSHLRMLDFGMGWGSWCHLVKAIGCESYGTELSKTRIEYTKSLGIKVIAREEILHIKFDFINTEQVFEHIPEPLDSLIFLKKSLKKGGIIKISVPDGRDIKRRLETMNWNAPKGSRDSLNAVSPLEHINCFNRSSIIAMANSADLEPIKLPLGIQYVNSTNWRPVKGILKNIFRPLYRNLSSRGTYIFFRPRRYK